jgi:hypothetical protein
MLPFSINPAIWIDVGIDGEYGIVMGAHEQQMPG